jgi:hypothetical protein
MSSEEFVDQVLTSLRVISMIKEGQKVKVRDGHLSLETHSTGIITGIRRWINRDNRVTTLRYIRNAVIQGVSLYNTSKDERVKQGLMGALNGLTSLSVTYGDDAGVTAAIDVIRDRISFQEPST